MDGTIVTVALPAVGSEFGVGSNVVSLVLTAYFVSYGLTLFPGGSLVDRAGSLRIGLIGLAVFALGAGIGGLAPSFEWLVASRVLQGIGAGLVSPATLAGAVSGFAPARRSAALGIWGASSGVANLAGPLVGGLLTVGLDWRACWWFFIPMAALAAWAMGRFVPGEVHEDETPETSSLQQRTIALAALAAALTFVIMIGTFFIAQQYLQLEAGYSALGAAAALTGIAVLVAVAAPLSGPIVDRWGERFTISAGWALTAAALAGLGLPGAPLEGAGALALLLPFGLGLGLLFVPTSRAALNAVPSSRHGRVSSLLSMARLLGAALGAGLAGVALSGGTAAANVHLALLIGSALCLTIGIPAATQLPSRASRDQALDLVEPSGRPSRG
jgi:MFS family permease